MKFNHKLIVALLLTSFSLTNTFAQNDKEMTIPTSSSTEFNWKDGYGKIVKVDFSYLITDTVSQKTLRPIIMTIMVQSQYLLKNKLSYVPRKLTLVQAEDKSFSGIVTILGKNSYGAESETTAYYSFDLEGNVVLISAK